MKHIDGVGARLQHPDGTRVTEYQDSEDGDPPFTFKGSLGIRQVALYPNTHIEATITFDESFNLDSADGVWIEISSGSPVGDVNLSDTGQYWWLDRNSVDTIGEHKFSFITTWEGNDADSATALVPLTMPGPSTGDVQASYTWINDKKPALGKCSLMIFVGRGKLAGEMPGTRRERHRKVWEPPKALQYSNVDGPRIIRRSWVLPLRSAHGLPYIFEYRNTETGSVDSMQQEAQEEIGEMPGVEPEDSDCISSFEGGNSESSDQVEEEEEEEEDNDSQDLNEGEEMDWENDDYTNEKDFHEFLDANASEASMESDDEEVFTARRRRASRRATANNPRSCVANTPTMQSTQQRSAIVKLKTNQMHEYGSGKPMDEDDSEDLPTSMKGRGFSGQRFTRLQVATPASSRTTSVRDSPANNSIFSSDHKLSNTWRGQRTGILSFLKSDGVQNADSTAEWGSPFHKAQGRRLKRRVDVDLTPDVDDYANQIKQEARRTPPMKKETQHVVTAGAVEEEDEEDLEYQLQMAQVKREELEIKRKLLAKRKERKMARFN